VLTSTPKEDVNLKLKAPYKGENSSSTKAVTAEVALEVCICACFTTLSGEVLLRESVKGEE